MAMLLMAVIAGMVFAIARSSLNLGQAIVKAQGEEMEQQAFFDFLSRRFASMPGNARMELISQESGTVYLSDLTLQNVPMSFTWGGQDLLAQAVQISTVQTRSGYLNIVMRYYENEILEGSADTSDANIEEEPYAEIVLLRDIRYFEWRVLDANDMEQWYYDWEEQGRLPLQIELQLAIGAEGEPLRHVFWLPPKQNPEVIMRQMGSNNEQPRGNPSAPTEGGGTGVGIGVGGVGTPGSGVIVDPGSRGGGR